MVELDNIIYKHKIALLDSQQLHRERVILNQYWRNGEITKEEFDRFDQIVIEAMRGLKSRE